MKSYHELIQIPTIEERIKYLQTNNHVGADTFGSYRYLNQRLYQSKPWHDFRHKIVIRDLGCDLAMDGFPVLKGVIHHINPLTVEDLLEDTGRIFDPDNVVLAGFNTHNLIHYGYGEVRGYSLNVRRPNDQCPWK